MSDILEISSDDTVSSSSEALEEFEESSSSEFEESSSSEFEESSSSVVPAEIKPSGYYTTNCPAGKTCSYVTTDYLNSTKTYGEILDERDYQVYKTIEFCDDANTNCQTWIAQNLNYAYKGVKYKYDSYTSDSTSWCYENATKNCDTYGRLYTWSAAIDSVALAKDGYTCGFEKKCDRLTADALAANPIQGVCPSGWHLPSNDEWDALHTAVGGYSTAGKALKSTSGWNSSGNGSDAYGFSALPAGIRHYDGNFRNAGDNAYFWSASQGEGSSYYANSMYLNSYSEYAGLYDYDKNYGYSVRCIKN